MNLHSILLIFVLTSITATNDAALKRMQSLQSQIEYLLAMLQSIPMDAVLYWNFVILQAGANDYDSSIAAVPDNIGPTTAARSFAIIHGAMYESIVAFNQNYKSFFKINNIPDTNVIHKKSATNAAIMEAAYRTLYALYPKQKPIFNAVRHVFLKQLENHAYKRIAIRKGIRVGRRIAKFILNNRKNDGSHENNTYTPIMHPGYHQADPTHPYQGYWGPSWGSVKPFILTNVSQFLPSNFIGETPAARLRYLNSGQYVIDFNTIKAFGAKASTLRTPDQTEIGLFWAYDEAPQIGLPPRLYNQIVRAVALGKNNTLEENAQLFALVNYAMADAGTVAWKCKFHYNFWRPIVAIRQAVGATQPDPNWLPLGSPPLENSDSHFTPPFPAYVSGHSTFGSAVFETLRQFFRSDKIQLDFQSDEFNGKTIDSTTGKPRPIRTRHYQSFTQMETENYLSRIYLGIHWQIDQEHGLILGRKVAQYIFKKFNREKTN